MRRLLIVGCSATKDPAPGKIPALDRYRGAYYQMIRQVPREDLPDVVILSAEFGFISATTLIADYDRRLTKARAAELVAGRGLPLGGLSLQFFDALDRCIYDETMIAAGWLYRGLIDHSIEKTAGAGVAYFGRRVYTSGGIGTQRSQLKAWLSQRGD